MTKVSLYTNQFAKVVKVFGLSRIIIEKSYICKYIVKQFDMKILLRLVLLLLLTNAVCFGQSPKKVVKIDREDFLTKVVDYTKDSTGWNYLGDKPAIIDFYADWCKPCKIVSPILDKLAKEYSGRIYIYKVNVDEQKQLAKEIGISSIPTIIFSPLEKEPRILVGAQSEEQLREYIENILLN